MIELNNVSKKYSKRILALKNVSLKIEQGEFVCVVGASGAGKSTLLKLIIGAIKASSGDVLVDSESLSSFSRHELAMHRRSLGIVFQDCKLLVDRTIASNVALPLEIQCMKNSEISKRVSAVLKSVGLGSRGNDMPLELSGGEQQRVALARAIVHAPSVLIADEPTGNLDLKLAKKVFGLLQKVNRAGITVILASHNLPLTEQYGKRTLVLDRGNIIGDMPNLKEKVKRGEKSL